MADKAKVEAFIWKQLVNLAKEQGYEELKSDDDMLAEGLMDSVGLLNVIMEIEKEFQLTVDFGRIDPEGFSDARSIAVTLAGLAVE